MAKNAIMKLKQFALFVVIIEAAFVTASSNDNRISLEFEEVPALNPSQDDNEYRALSRDEDSVLQIYTDEQINLVQEDDTVKNIQCTLCKEVISVAMKIGHKHTQQDIKNVLYRACNKLHYYKCNKCHEFIDKHGDKIASMMLHAMKPKRICKIIQICAIPNYENFDSEEKLGQLTTSTTMEGETNDLVRLFKEVSGAETTKDVEACKICYNSLTQMKNLVENMKNIEEKLKAMCKKNLTIFSEICDKYIFNFNQYIKHINPKTFCHNIGFCQ